MKSLLLLYPEIFLCLAAFALLLAETIWLKGRRRWIVAASVAVLVAMVPNVFFFVKGHLPLLGRIGLLPTTGVNAWVQYAPVMDMVVVDSLSVFFKIAILLAVAVVLWLSIDYREFTRVPHGLLAFLLLMSAAGMLLFVGSIDLLMAILSLELLSISSFILTGVVRERKSASEAAMKYFLVGSFSTALYLFGVSFYYAAFGTTSLLPFLSVVSQIQGLTFNFGVLTSLIFILAGLGFKIAMVPFHMWAPDTYEGAPTPVTAFLSSAPKAAAIGFIIRFFSHHEALQMTTLLAFLSALTMTVGNVAALKQTNLKRLLAYSSIAQVGYILAALVAGGSAGIQAVLIYTVLYLFMNLGVFVGVVAVSNQTGSSNITALRGLYRTNFGLALSLTLFLLSMTGIPPLAGFIGKFSIFTALLQSSGLLWLAVVAAVNSVISLFYYFRIAHQMFFVEDEKPLIATTLKAPLLAALGVTLLITVGAGLFPSRLLDWVRSFVGS